MTILDIVSAMLRRWYVPLGILACAALLMVLLVRDGGIYTTRTVMTLRHPAGTSLSPTNGTTDASVIAFAAAVVLDVNNSRPPASYSMADAPYYGAGIREGALVEMSNSGSQWVSSISRAEIEIDIAGRTFAWVESRQQELIDEVLHIVDSQQDLLGIPPALRIEASVIPLTTQIEYVTPSRRSGLTAAAALFAVAIIISAWGSLTIDGMLSKRRPVPRQVTRAGRLGGGLTP